jgi:hypothetical protein
MKPSLLNIPLLVLGNKNDLPTALSVEELIQRLFAVSLRPNLTRAATSKRSRGARCAATASPPRTKSTLTSRSSGLSSTLARRSINSLLWQLWYTMLNTTAPPLPSSSCSKLLGHRLLLSRPFRHPLSTPVVSPARSKLLHQTPPHSQTHLCGQLRDEPLRRVNGLLKLGAVCRGQEVAVGKLEKQLEGHWGGGGGEEARLRGGTWASLVGLQLREVATPRVEFVAVSKKAKGFVE